MKKIIILFLFGLLCLTGCDTIITQSSSIESSTTEPSESSTTGFENYGMPILDVYLSDTNITLSGIYSSKEEVGAYIFTFHKLPSNFVVKSIFSSSNHTAANKLSAGGDVFQNREGLLPKKIGRTYTECDIDYTGGGRNAKRIVFSSDFLIFYTDTHYASFSIMRFL